MKVRPRRRYTCSVCGGEARRRLNIATSAGLEDAHQPLLHVNQSDWVDNPHDVVPVDPDGEVVS